MLLTVAFSVYLLLLGVVAYDDLAIDSEEHTLKA